MTKLTIFSRDWSSNFDIFLADWLISRFYLAIDWPNSHFFQCLTEKLRFLSAIWWQISRFFSSNQLANFVIFYHDRMTKCKIFPRDWGTNFADFFPATDYQISRLFGRPIDEFCCFILRQTDVIHDFFRLFLTEKFCDFYPWSTDEFLNFFHVPTWQILWYSPAKDWNFSIFFPRSNDEIYVFFHATQDQ